MSTITNQCTKTERSCRLILTLRPRWKGYVNFYDFPDICSNFASSAYNIPKLYNINKISGPNSGISGVRVVIAIEDLQLIPIHKYTYLLNLHYNRLTCNQITSVDFFFLLLLLLFCSYICNPVWDLRKPILKRFLCFAA